jgi:hypothetical protein
LRKSSPDTFEQTRALDRRALELLRTLPEFFTLTTAYLAARDEQDAAKEKACKAPLFAID